MKKQGVFKTKWGCNIFLCFYLHEGFLEGAEKSVGPFGEGKRRKPRDTPDRLLCVLVCLGGALIGQAFLVPKPLTHVTGSNGPGPVDL